MNKKAPTPLDESIAHWERMATRRRINNETPKGMFCALCQQFEDCIGCPVAEKTGLDDCRNTPWLKANDAFYYHGPDSDEFVETAEEMLEFLKSLRPIETQK